jgi:hypothetical protein
MGSWLTGKVTRLRWHASNLMRSAVLAWRWQQHGRHYGARRVKGNRVVVSLTSYPPRFSTLHLTLKSLLSQSFLPERVVLWIAHADMPLLPPAVTALQAAGLEIKACDDLKSYKKMIPLLQETLDLTIVTADDDVYYWHDWLQQLVAMREPGKLEVICHRMHRMRLEASGNPLPYNDWEFESTNHESSVLNFPTGIGGTLYPAGVFDSRVLDIDSFMTLCPRGDDIWFWWMARARGATFRRTGSGNEVFCWDGTQEIALWRDNLGINYNDRQIRAMIDAYGFTRETA